MTNIHKRMSEKLVLRGIICLLLGVMLSTLPVKQARAMTVFDPALNAQMLAKTAYDVAEDIIKLIQQAWAGAVDGATKSLSSRVSVMNTDTINANAANNVDKQTAENIQVQSHRTSNYSSCHQAKSGQHASNNGMGGAAMGHAIAKSQDIRPATAESLAKEIRVECDLGFAPIGADSPYSTLYPGCSN